MSDAREAGRELDAEIAEKVMGWKRAGPDDGFAIHASEGGVVLSSGPERFTVGILPFPWYPSTDIGAAWLVVEHVCDNLGYDLAWKMGGNVSDGWWAQVFDTSPMGYVDASGCTVPAFPGYETDWERTLPLAICLAALKAVVLSRAVPDPAHTGDTT